MIKWLIILIFTTSTYAQDFKSEYPAVNKIDTIYLSVPIIHDNLKNEIHIVVKDYILIEDLDNLLYYIKLFLNYDDIKKQLIIEIPEENITIK